MVVMLVESLLIFLFPEMLAQMFGATDSLIEQSRTPFRLMCLALLPKAITETLSMHINHKYMNGVNCIYLNFYRA